MEIISNNIELVMLGLTIVILTTMIKLGGRKQVLEILFYLVVKAEQEFGSGTGELKFASVVTWLYSHIPTVYKFLFTKKEIDKMIEFSVQRMKEYLTKNTYAKNII